MPDIFKEIIPSILEKNETVLEVEEDEKDYSGFIVNKALSAHIDCLYHANLMNANPHLDGKLQYDYLFHSVKKYKRRYQKWMKYTEPKEIQLIKEYYNYSTVKAKQIAKLLTDEQMEIIAERLNKGGKIK